VPSTMSGANRLAVLLLSRSGIPTQLSEVAMSRFTIADDSNCDAVSSSGVDDRLRRPGRDGAAVGWATPQPGGGAVAEPEQPFASSEETMAAFARQPLCGQGRALSLARLELVMGRREGIRFWDAYSGRSWINCHCNGGVFNLGHRHPRVVAALRAAPRRARRRQTITSFPGFRAATGVPALRDDPRPAARPSSLHPGAARSSTSRSRPRAAPPAGSGWCRRWAAITATPGSPWPAGDPEYRDPFGPNLPGFVQVPFGDLDALAAVVDHDTAAVLLEPIPGHPRHAAAAAGLPDVGRRALPASGAPS